MRRFLRQTEAELARLSLEEHGIFCQLSGENAHLYGGAPFAMPIVLMVADDDLERAKEVLRDEAHGTETAPLPSPAAQPAKGRGKKNDPWEILALAGLLVLPAIALLLQREPRIWVLRRRTQSLVTATPHALHVFGVLVLAVVVSLVVFYFYVRNLIARDELAETDADRSRGGRF